MKFLVKFRSSTVPVVPYEKEAEKAMRGMKAWLENPRVLHDYAIVGTRDSISVWEGHSLEQLHIDIMMCPSHRLGEWEIVPLIDNRNPGDWQREVEASDALSNHLDDRAAITAVSVSAEMCAV